MKIDIGMSQKGLKEVAEGLSDFLADTYSLYLKTQNFHWNIVGPDFYALHILFEKHYENMAEGIDEIAERIRALGQFAEGSFSAFKKRSSIKEETKAVKAEKMITKLIEGHELISRNGRKLIKEAQGHHDEITVDLIIKRLGFHEKAAWMLRSHLEKIQK